MTKMTKEVEYDATNPEHVKLAEEISVIEIGISDAPPILQKDKFDAIFLPFFVNPSGGSMEERSKFIEGWVSTVSGSPTRWVNIVGENNVVLFSIPPIIDTTSMHRINNASVSGPSQILNTLRMEKNTNSALAPTNFDNSISDYFNRLDLSGNTDSRWDSFISYYGLYEIDRYNGGAVNTEASLL